MTKNRTEKGIFLLLFFHKKIQFICLQHMEEKGIRIGMLGFLVGIIRSHQAVLILKKSQRHRTTDEHITQQCDTNI